MAPNPTDILPPGGDDPPEPPRASRQQRIACEFCECTLTHRGEVLAFSDKAKKFRSHDETIEKRDVRIAQLESELAEAKRKLTEATTVRETRTADLDLA